MFRFRSVMGRWPIRNHPMVVIELQPRQLAPQGADWIELGPVIGAGWGLDGNLPVPRNLMSAYGTFPHQNAALWAALEFAMSQGCELVYIEIDARRCTG